MQSTTITEVITDVEPVLRLRGRSRVERVRNAFMRMSLIFEQESFDVDEVLALAYAKANLSDRQKHLLRELVASRELFSRVPDLGSRVATFSINPSTGEPRKSLPAERARRALIRAERVWDNMMEDVRSNKFLAEQADMVDGKFTYRTLMGARFPKLVSKGELDLMSEGDATVDVSIHTEFSGWSGITKFKSYSMPSDALYSSSAKDSGMVYGGRVIMAKFRSNGLQVKGHAMKRLRSYGYDSEMITLESNTVEAIISSGRSVPNWSMERPTPSTRKVSYKITFELLNVEVKLSSNATSVCKLIISGYVSPSLDKRTVTMSEYLESGSNILDIIDPFVVTVIPLTIPGSKSRLRATGMPVIPYDAAITDVSPAVLAIKGEESQDDGDTLTSMVNADLRRTDQWLNVSHDEVKSFCSDSPHLAKMYEDNKYSYITKCGVEFADVEYIRDNYPVLFDDLLNVGLEMLTSQSNISRETETLSKTDVVDAWSEFFDKSSGPSIVHSEEIRSPNQEAQGVKPVTSSLLLVRIVLSRILIVGIGESTHRPMNPEVLPTPHHLINQKRAEAMLIPLSVMKDGLLVYTLTGSVGRLLKDVTRSNLSGSVLHNIIRGSVISGDMPTNIIDELTSQSLFKVRAPILVVSPKSPAMTDLWFIAPSGIEFDVTPIAMEICSKLSEEMLLSPISRSVLAWHPLFTIVVSKTLKSNGSFKYDSILLPAKRKSSIAVSYHNTTEVIRATDFNSEVRMHYATMREGAGYVSALKTYISGIP
jgi:hypothetical protein